MIITTTATKLLPIPTSASLLRVTVWKCSTTFDERTGVALDVWEPAAESVLINAALVSVFSPTTLRSTSTQYVLSGSRPPDMVAGRTVVTPANEPNKTWYRVHSKPATVLNETKAYCLTWLHADIARAGVDFITLEQETV